MIRKTAVVYLSTLLCLAFLCTGCLSKKEKQNKEPEITVKQNNTQKTTTQPKVEIKKYDLYSTTPFDIPLFSIVEISKISPILKSSIDKLLEESQGFYLLRFDGENVFAILQNPISETNTFRRHDLQFAEINSNGNITYHNAGYAGIVGEIFEEINPKYDNWVFDKKIEPLRPIKHTVFDEKGKIKFIETWNYNENEPIKYQMKDANKKTLSILKEIQETDSNYRKEHVFYDNEGNIKMSLTINYDGANISRLTFYNSHDSIDSMSIISEFENGFKKKEYIYNEEYKLVNSFIAEYLEDERKCIKVYDSEGVEINKISS